MKFLRLIETLRFNRRFNRREDRRGAGRETSLSFSRAGLKALGPVVGLTAGLITSSLSSVETRPILFSAAALGSLVTACTTPEKYDSSTPEGAFKQAEEYENDDRYEEAIQKFTDVKNKYPYSRFATEAELRIADLQFKRESYIEAAGAYQLFREFHPKHQRIDYVTFRLGLSYFNQLPSTSDRDLSVADKAINYFDEVINSYPNSEFVKESKDKRQDTLHMLADKEMYVGNFYSKHDMYDSALKRYEYLLKTYPDEGFDAAALYGAAKSAFKVGERERGQQHLKNLYSLYPSSDEAKRAKNEFEKLGSN